MEGAASLLTEHTSCVRGHHQCPVWDYPGVVGESGRTGEVSGRCSVWWSGHLNHEFDILNPMLPLILPTNAKLAVLVFRAAASKAQEGRQTPKNQ